MIAFSGVRSSWLTAASVRFLAIASVSAASLEAASDARSPATSSLLRKTAMMASPRSSPRIISRRNGRYAPGPFLSPGERSLNSTR